MNTASVIAPAFIHSSIKRRRNTWYSINDGNWSDPTVWMSNASKRYSYPGQNIATPIFPQIGDDVYINHVVIANATITVNNLCVSGTLKGDANTRVLYVNGNIQCTGIVDFTSSNINLYLRGVNNDITTFTSGTLSTITYGALGYNQTILNLSYFNLSVENAGIKYPIANCTVAGNLNLFNSAVLQLSTFNLTVTGNTICAYQTYLLKSGSGTVLFTGYAQSTTISGIDFRTGNPSVECRGGLRYGNNDAGQYNKLTNFYIQGGLGKWSFTTNNQTTTQLAGYNFAKFQDVDIAAGITLTLTTLMQIEGTINGLSSTSKLLCNNGTLALNTSVQPMVTGILDITTYANDVYYVMDGAFTIWHANYWNLWIIQCTGTKTLGYNTTLLGLLNTGATILELSSYALTVTGTTTVNGTLKKASSTGAVTFIGTLSTGNSSGDVGVDNIDFTAGNPTVELRNGYTSTNLLSSALLTGTGTWNFTTNNQTIQDLGNSILGIFNAPMLISGAITVTRSSLGGLIHQNTINGNNAASTLDNRGLIQYQAATAPMATGILQTNAAANTFKYNLLGNQDVTGGTYRTLEFGGSGVKTLLGNVVINTTAGGSQSTTGSATINLNGFTITTI